MPIREVNCLECNEKCNCGSYDETGETTCKDVTCDVCGYGGEDIDKAWDIDGTIVCDECLIYYLEDTGIIKRVL